MSSGLNDIEKSTLMLGGKGVESFLTRFKMKRKHLAVSASIGIVAAVLVWSLYLLLITPTTASLIGNSIALDGEGQARVWVVKCRRADFEAEAFKCGSRSKPDQYVDVKVSLPGGGVMLSRSQYEAFIRGTFIPVAYAWYEPSPGASSTIAGLLALVAMAAASWFAFRWFVGFGREDTKNLRIGGVYDLVDAKALSQMVVESKGGASGWKIADVDLPKKSMVMGLGVSGAQGSGKSLALHDLIVQAEHKDVRLFINDPSGEFWTAHGKPDNGDVFWNPALVGTVNWSIFKELNFQHDADILAYAFLPKRESKGNGDFFDDAGRSLFATLVNRLAQAGTVNTNEIAKAFFEATEDEMAALVAGTSAADAVSGDAKGMRAGVMASVGIHMRGIKVMADGDWSMRDFLALPKGNIYFVGDEEMFRGVKRLMISAAFEIIKSSGVRVPDLKYLFVLDEYPILGDVDVDRHLAEKRKFGVGIVLGMQAETQLETMMGKSRAATTLSVLNTYLQLRVPDPDAQKKAEERFGKQEVRMVGENQTLAIADSKDSLGVTKNVQEKALIPAANFGLLGVAQGYIKVMGNFPAAKVDYAWWLSEKSGLDGVDTRANDIGREVRPYPSKDERFRMVAEGNGDWRKQVRIDLLRANIYNNEQALVTSTGAKAVALRASIAGLYDELVCLLDRQPDQADGEENAQQVATGATPPGLLGAQVVLQAAEAAARDEQGAMDKIDGALDDLLTEFEDTGKNGDGPVRDMPDIDMLDMDGL